MKLTQPITSSRAVNWTVRLLLCGLLVFVASLIVIPFLPDGFSGRADAERDIARVHYELRLYGKLSPWISDYAASLRDNYGIKVRGLPGGCIVSEWQFTYYREYNSVQRAAIIKRFGRDILSESADEARTAWKQKHARP